MRRTLKAIFMGQEQKHPSRKKQMKEINSGNGTHLIALRSISEAFTLARSWHVEAQKKWSYTDVFQVVPSQINESKSAVVGAISTWQVSFQIALGLKTCNVERPSSQRNFNDPQMLYEKYYETLLLATTSDES